MTATEATEITGTVNHDESWEKQAVYDLSNGFTVTVEFSHCYGDMISRIDNATVKDYPETMVWHCSNGLATLPEWAEPWIEVVQQAAQIKLVRPGFKKIYS
jgi:hypothetical protein